MNISIIIVNYNTGKLLAECIASIYKYEDGNKIEIIIVDNNSSDNSAELIKNITEKYSGVSGIFLKTKVSFSAANNIGYESSKGEFILIMNPDIIFIEPVLDRLTEIFIHNSSAGAVSPMLIGTDGKFQRRYFQRYPSVLQFIYFYSILGGVFLKSDSKLNKYLENHEIELSKGRTAAVEQIPCAFFLTKKNIFEEAGKMDERYDLFFEDVDLSYQINKKYTLIVDTSLKVKHLGGESFKSSDDYWLHGQFITSMVKFFEKNYDKKKTFFLKMLVSLNSRTVLAMESVKKIFGKPDEYRVKKHKHLLEKLRQLNS